MPKKPRQIESLALTRLCLWIPKSAAWVISTLQERGFAAFIVGGAVRDCVLGKHPKDWDVATSATPEEVTSAFPRTIAIGARFGTICVLAGKERVEVTTFRSESTYSDGRRPDQVEFVSAIEDDLSRRDFTINALAATVTPRRLVDPFGGCRDASDRLLRTVGDPRQRFFEDGLRALRAVRFASVLGFRLHQGITPAIQDSLAVFRKVSWERKRDELEKVLGQSQDVAQAIQLLHEVGLLLELAPLPGRDSRLSALNDIPAEPWWLRLVAWAHLGSLPQPAWQDLARLWRLPTQVSTQGGRMLAALSVLPAPNAPKIRRWIAQAGVDVAGDAAQIARALYPSTHARLPHHVRQVLSAKPCLHVHELLLSGDDLKDLGLQGRAIGRVQRALLAWVIEKPSRNQSERLRAQAARLALG